MSSIRNSALDLRQLDLLANRDSPVHRLDPRAKVMVTFLFIISVVSFEKHEISALIPYFIFPAVMLSLSDLPLLYIIRKILFVSPFIMAIGIFNPLIDHEPMVMMGYFSISRGWLSFLSIVIRSVLTVGAGFILIGTTGFTPVCQALQRLGTPGAFAMQLFFLYRYIYVLAEEGNRASRARDLRTFGNKEPGIKSFGSMLGCLLVRTWQRAERIHLAMLARGFNGKFNTRITNRFGSKEFIFLTAWSAAFILFRLYNLPNIIGNLTPDIFLLNFLP